MTPGSADAATAESERLAWTAAAFTIVVWGSAFTGIAIALASFGPGVLALARFGVASLVLAVAAVVRPVARPAASDVPRLVGISLAGITVYHLLLNFGQQAVSPGAASLLIQTSPMFTTLLAARFDGERVTGRRWVGIAIATAGAAVIVVGRGQDVAFSARALAILACALATSVYFVFGRPLTRRYGARSMTTWSMWIGTMPLLVFAPALARQWPTASSEAIRATVYIGVFPAAIAYLTWNMAVGRLGASRVSVLLYTSPLVAMATQYAWFGTFPSATSLIGGAAAIAGTAIATRR